MGKKVKLFNMNIDALRMQEAVDTIFDWIKNPTHECHYVVTPNVDHVVQFQNNQDLRSAYDGASLVLADGKPVVFVSRLLGKSLPETVPGSDLAPGLFKRAQTKKGEPIRIYLLGAAEGVADAAALKIESSWPNVKVVGTYSPPVGFEHDARENENIIAKINLFKPDVLIIGLGAPKQETWIYNHSKEIHSKVALCLGATIDFLAGEKQRAPIWMRKVGLEWLHRMLTEPRRLAGRYAHDAWVFPQIIWKTWRNS